MCFQNCDMTCVYKINQKISNHNNLSDPKSVHNPGLNILETRILEMMWFIYLKNDCANITVTSFRYLVTWSLLLFGAPYWFSWPCQGKHVRTPLRTLIPLMTWINSSYCTNTDQLDDSAKILLLQPQFISTTNSQLS